MQCLAEYMPQEVRSEVIQVRRSCFAHSLCMILVQFEGLEIILSVHMHDLMPEAMSALVTKGKFSSL